MSVNLIYRHLGKVGTKVLAEKDGSVVAEWRMPYGGTPYGVHIHEQGVFYDYMKWLFAVEGGTPKAWVVSNGYAYWLTSDPHRTVGYAPLSAEGGPLWGEASIADYAEEDVEPQVWADTRQAEKVLHEAEALAPALTKRS